MPRHLLLVYSRLLVCFAVCLFCYLGEAYAHQPLDYSVSRHIIKPKNLMLICIPHPTLYIVLEGHGTFIHMFVTVEDAVELNKLIPVNPYFLCVALIRQVVIHRA